MLFYSVCLKAAVELPSTAKTVLGGWGVGEHELELVHGAMRMTVKLK